MQVACRPHSDHRICFILLYNNSIILWALLVGEICNEVFQKVIIKNFFIIQHDFVTPQMLAKRKENIPVSACLKSKILSLCISLRASSPFISSKASPGEGLLPYKGLMGTCGKPGYVFQDFCLKQGIEFVIFFLNQGIDLSIFVLNRISFLGR